MYIYLEYLVIYNIFNYVFYIINIYHKKNFHNLLRLKGKLIVSFDV